MNTRNMPGFTAEASLYNGKARYTGKYQKEALGEQRGELQRPLFIPQLAGPDAPGWYGCVWDCRDENPSWTKVECERSCRDPGGAGGPPSPPRDPVNCALSFRGIDFWYAACVVNPVAYGVSWLSSIFGGPTCESIRDEKYRETISSGCIP
jgi:hypothetical protein